MKKFSNTIMTTFGGTGGTVIVLLPIPFAIAFTPGRGLFFLIAHLTHLLLNFAFALISFEMNIQARG